VIAASLALITQPGSGSGSANASGLTPPAIPSTGAYLGAFVGPNQSDTVAQSDIRIELSEMGTFEGTIGRPLGLVHVFQDWRNPVRNSALAAFAGTGAIPVIDWGCIADASVISGSQDAFITSYAKSLAAYGRPVFLRWFWEMNLTQLTRNKGCLGTLGATGYVQAWQHIWNLFQAAGAYNVSFVWCPSVQTRTSPTPYYPGDQYVGWIGFDGYDRDQDPTIITTQFVPFYDTWSTHDKPMMIAETGATSDQATFLSDLAAALPTTFPGIKAVMYYDSEGALNWTLTDATGNNGLSQFISMGQLPYFSYPFAGS
jgi:hypothetical protein